MDMNKKQLEEVEDMRETLIVMGMHSESYYRKLQPAEVIIQYDRMMKGAGN